MPFALAPDSSHASTTALASAAPASAASSDASAEAEVEAREGGWHARGQGGEEDGRALAMSQMQLVAAGFDGEVLERLLSPTLDTPRRASTSDKDTRRKIPDVQHLPCCNASLTPEHHTPSPEGGRGGDSRISSKAKRRPPTQHPHPHHPPPDLLRTLPVQPPRPRPE